MKAPMSAAIACTYFGMVVCLAQETAPSDEQGSQNSQAAGLTAPTDLDSAEPETGELTRAERRAIRRSEREAARIASEEAAAVEAELAVDEGIICRRETIIGSHRRVRICTTRAERDATREAAQEVMRERTPSPVILGQDQNGN